MKSYLITVVFSLCIQQYCCQRGPKFSCSDPMIKLNEGNELYRTEIEGSKDGEGYYLRDKQFNKTMFVYAVIDAQSMRDDHKHCDVDVSTLSGFRKGFPDTVGQIISHELGGSCDAANLFPQNYSCKKGLWLMFQRWTQSQLESHDRVLFCARLSYAEDGSDSRPSIIVSSTYTYPGNEPLRSIAINNPLIDECEIKPNALYG